MPEIAEKLTDLVGNTPLLELLKYGAKHACGAKLIAKPEGFNPGGSVKDRIALAMVDDACKRGLLREGSLIIEPTSGNTGIGLAMVAARKGYRLVLTMPETMSIERRQLLAALGAEIVLTPAVEGMPGAMARAAAMLQENKGAVTLGQFDNPANPAVHRRTTGPEIWEGTGGKVDVFVAGVGTGGTISGAGSFLKEKNPSVEIVAIEPAESPVLSGGKAGPHKIQGIGAGFIPKVYDAHVVDRILCVTGEQALETMRELSLCEGLLAGVSSGAALFAAVQLARLPQYADKNIVVLLPDTGERYLSVMSA